MYTDIGNNYYSKAKIYIFLLEIPRRHGYGLWHSGGSLVIFNQISFNFQLYSKTHLHCITKPQLQGWPILLCYKRSSIYLSSLQHVIKSQRMKSLLHYKCVSYYNQVLLIPHPPKKNNLFIYNNEIQYQKLCKRVVPLSLCDHQVAITSNTTIQVRTRLLQDI